MPRYRRVVVTLDGSAAAESVIPFILDIAGPLDMEIVLVRVVTPVAVEAGVPVPGVVAEEQAARTTEAREYLSAIAAQLSSRGVRAEVHVRRGAPVPEILAAAREVSADLVAMTTHGRSGLRRLLLGSVAEDVLRRADTPVLLMRLAAAGAEGATTDQRQEP